MSAPLAGMMQLTGISQNRNACRCQQNTLCVSTEYVWVGLLHQLAMKANRRAWSS